VSAQLTGAVPVLVVAAGARWEPTALESLHVGAGVVVLRRCMDVTDLLAHAAAGDARVAVIAAEAPGLDVDAIGHLARSGVLPLVVFPEELDGAAERVRRLGVRSLVGDRHLAELPAAVLALSRSGDEAPVAAARVDPSGAGRVIAVWGPAGAPGRTTVALGLAGELASRGGDPLLLDLDPWGGAVAQRLGVLDEVSGLLAAARLAGRSDLAEGFASLQRRVAGFRVLTGLPRADRWLEVRGEVVDELVDLAREQGDVLLDTGFSLEDDPLLDLGSRPTRNGLTLAALAAADDLVVVGTADPVGLSRLARALSELGETTGGRPVHVVLNRWRSRLGLDEAEVRRLLAGYGELLGLHVVPDDGLAADRSLVTGRTFVEGATSPLARSFVPIVDALFPGRATTPPPRRLRGRTAGRVRRR
jgi:MinD-like ATPase involved in chromosome partitioning or flagellar assembly